MSEQELSVRNNTIYIYTDGACRGNGQSNNVGAYAYKLVCGEKTRAFAKAVRNTTNNIMELTAVIAALEALKDAAKGYSIVVYSDSQYVILGITQWIQNWIVKNFNGVKNVHLWRKLLEDKKKFPKISFVHVKGHATNDGNNEVDRLCNEAMDRLIKVGV